MLLQTGDRSGSQKQLRGSLRCFSLSYSYAMSTSYAIRDVGPTSSQRVFGWRASSVPTGANIRRPCSPRSDFRMEVRHRNEQPFVLKLGEKAETTETRIAEFVKVHKVGVVAGESSRRGSISSSRETERFLRFGWTTCIFVANVGVGSSREPPPSGAVSVLSYDH